MTKKDYEAFAAAIYDSWLSHRGEEYEDMRVDVHNNAIENLVMDFLPIFKADNSNFNEGRFLRACGL